MSSKPKETKTSFLKTWGAGIKQSVANKKKAGKPLNLIEQYATMRIGQTTPAMKKAYREAAEKKWEQRKASAFEAITGRKLSTKKPTVNPNRTSARSAIKKKQ